MIRSILRAKTPDPDVLELRIHGIDNTPAEEMLGVPPGQARLEEGDDVGGFYVPTVDPLDPTSTPVVQIESAMGAAIEVFDGAVVLEVDRSRFLPVKTTNDLLVLRSDVYRLTDDQRLVATVDAPYVDLDPAHFRTIGAFDQRLPTAPSLAGATSLRVRGDWTFGRDVAIVGDAVLTDGGAPSTVPDGAWVGPTGIA